MFKALAGAVGSNPNVLGYDILNEPWPGTEWSPCLNDPNGCPARDASGLDKLHGKVATAIRTEDPDHLVFGEPYVLFNFGKSKTHIALPGGDPNSGMSWHMYTTSPADEPAVIANAIDWSTNTGGALLNTEFGAVDAPADINRMVAEMDNALMPWMWWSYDHFVHDLTKPPTGSNIEEDQADALIRPHPTVIAGTPTALDYDPASRVLRFSWDTSTPSGTPLTPGNLTTIKVPPSVYANGYEVKITGGTVTSVTNANELTINSDTGATHIFVKVWSTGTPEPPDQKPGATTTTTTAPSATTPQPSTTPVNAPSATPVAGAPDFTG
jgi:endoglycosylceramidase